jgi:alginate O-acetyltransferase complex protein AlgI
LHKSTPPSTRRIAAAEPERTEMLFPTIDFAVFFAVVFPITWLLNRYNTWKKWFLVAASYYFYAYWKVEFVALLFASSLGNYLAALLLGRLADGILRRAVLWVAVAANLGLLGYFKYWNFFAAELINALSAFGIDSAIGFIEVALPIAISFLTFHALSYVIDVYRRQIKPTKSFVDILLYISFFPHLIAGPIVRANKFLAQAERRGDPADIRLGDSVFLIVGGLFKKVVVANYLSTDFVDGIFRDPAGFSSLDLLLGMYAYALQIYCDFSAYTDIAIGIARLLGYEFPQNFNQPYRALTLQDFWRRWHMSLSSWLRDYLYVPLGGGRGGALATYRNIMITMGLGGLWHGANWNFLIWGLLHGAALVIERIFGRTDRDAERYSPLRAAVAWFVTFQFVSITWVFFRSPSLEASFAYFKTLLTGGGWTTTMTPLVAVVFALGTLTQVIPAAWFGALKVRYDAAPLVLKVLVPFGAVFLIAVAAPNGMPPFIYFQF